MTKRVFTLWVLLSAGVLVHASARADDAGTIASTPPATASELEVVYTTAIEGRTEDILKLLALDDAAKSNRVHELIIAQYRALRARDEIIDARLKLIGKEINYANRAADLQIASKPLHQRFLAGLAKDLTPAQIETVKDKMTYNKVKITYDAYCAIVPGLTAGDKAEILDRLKAAREEAMDGGSAPEKSAIFQKYKDHLNEYLDTHGHNVAQAYREWNAKHPGQDGTNVMPSTTSAK